jgi:hypothetical protein
MPFHGGPTPDGEREAVERHGHRPRLAVATAGALFVLIVAVRWRNGGPADATALLFTVPIALLAATLGARAGVLASLLAIGFLVLWVTHAGVHLSPVGWAARLVPLLMMGTLLGAVTDRLRRAEAERYQLALGAHRRREAIEINDSIVQGLSAIKWSLDAGNTHQALALTAEHLELGHRLVSDLIRDAGLAGDWTGTSTPNAVT